MGAAMQYRMLVGAGMDPARIGTGLAAASLINVATLFALPVLALPAIVGGVAVDRGLSRAAWLGVALFVLLVGGGAVLLLLDKPIGAVARTIERIHNFLLRRRPAMHGLAERLTRRSFDRRATCCSTISHCSPRWSRRARGPRHRSCSSPTSRRWSSG